MLRVYQSCNTGLFYLVSKYEARELQRQVYVSGRIKTMNESIYYNVDAIHTAIAENKKIIFQYFQWNVKKEMELRHDGKYYHISPWGLSWDDENYYLAGFDSEAGIIKHYRVDKMLHITMSDEPREGKERFEKFDLAAYAKKSFGMYRSEAVYGESACRCYCRSFWKRRYDETGGRNTFYSISRCCG